MDNNSYLAVRLEVTGATFPPMQPESFQQLGNLVEDVKSSPTFNTDFKANLRTIKKQAETERIKQAKSWMFDALEREYYFRIALETNKQHHKSIAKAFHAVMAIVDAIESKYGYSPRLRSIHKTKDNKKSEKEIALIFKRLRAKDGEKETNHSS